MPHVDLVVDGNKWPSVTEFIGLPEKQWKWRWYEGAVRKNGWRGWQLCEATGGRGRRIGTDVHALVEDGLRQRMGQAASAIAFESPRRLMPFVRKVSDTMLAWFDKNGFSVVAMEQHLKDPTTRSHGTFDLVVTQNDTSYALVDWKTNSQPSDENPLQLACYADMWNNLNPGKPIRTGIIARVNKKLKTLKVSEDVYQNLGMYMPEVKRRRGSWDYIHKQGDWKRQ